MSRNYRLYYTSADSPADDSSWSVYREEYVSVEAEEPTEGLTVKISTHPTEAEADTTVRYLQGMEW